MRTALSPLSVARPTGLRHALRLLADSLGEERLVPLAGGTDLFVYLNAGTHAGTRFLDLSPLAELRGVSRTRGGGLRVGALATFREIGMHPAVRAGWPSLAAAARVVGAAQIQNRGTIGGNIANASPAGDTLPVLLALDAELDLISDAGERSMPLVDFLRGPGRTALMPGELIRRVCFAPLPKDARSLFLRLGNRRGMLISVVSAALVLARDEDGRVRDCRIALGAVAPVPIRCPGAEAMLLGRRLDSGLIAAVATAAAAACRPIDDVRASADYRRHGVQVLVRRGLKRLTEAEGGSI